MINACPGGPEWNKLVKAVGEFEAYRDYVENGETIRPTDTVIKKLIAENKIAAQTDNKTRTEKTVEAFNNKLETFLTQFGFTTEQLDDLQETTGYNIMGATDFLEKTIFVKKSNLKEAYSKEAAYVIFNLLGKKNILRKDLIASIHLVKGYAAMKAKYTSEKLSDYKVRELIAIDYLQKKLIEAHNNVLETSGKAVSEDVTAKNKLEYAILMIKKWWAGIVRKFLKSYKRGLIEDVYNQIAVDVLNNNTRLFNLAKDTTYKKMELSPEMQEINDNLVKFGAINSGSYALNRQGTLTRESINDLDYFIPYAYIDSFIEKVKEEYPNAKFLEPFSGVMGNRSMTLPVRIGDVKIDLFIPMSEEESRYNKIVVIDGTKYMHWKNIFDAKIRIGSKKHLSDLAGFVPFSKTDTYIDVYNFDKVSKRIKEGSERFDQLEKEKNSLLKERDEIWKDYTEEEKTTLITFGIDFMPDKKSNYEKHKATLKKDYLNSRKLSDIVNELVYKLHLYDPKNLDPGTIEAEYTLSLDQKSLNIIGQRHYNFEFIQSRFNPEEYSSGEEVNNKASVRNYWDENITQQAYEYFKANNIDIEASEQYKTLLEYFSNNKDLAVTAYYITFSENFKKFYGNLESRKGKVPFSLGSVVGNYSKRSVLLDKNGEPAIFYHGAGTTFDKFSKDYFLSGEGAMAYGAGFYATNFKPTADRYRDTAKAAREMYDKLIKEQNQELLNLIDKIGPVSNSDWDKIVTGYSDEFSGEDRTELLSLLGITETKGLYIALTNPLYWEEKISPENKQAIETHFRISLKDDISGNIYRELEKRLKISDKEVSARLYQIGIDGVVRVAHGGQAVGGFSHKKGELHVIFFEPVQAKSVTNTGLFSVNNDNMYDPIDVDNAIVPKDQAAPISDEEVIKEMIETIPGLKTYSTKVELTPIETDVRKANGLVQAMVQQLSSRLNIPYEFVTADQARDILEKAGKPFTNQAGFYVGGKVYLIADQLNLDTAIHEFSHPFVRAIQQENPELFDKLFNELSLSEEGQKVLDITERLYGKEDPLFKEEALVRALTRAAKLKLTGTLDAPNNKSFKSLVSKILYAIKQAFRKYFGKTISVSELDVDTTIDDLSEMLLSADQINFDVEAVSQDDIIAEERRIKDEIDTFLNIGNTDSGAIAIKSMISDLTRISKEHIDRLVKNRNLKEMAEILKSGYDESDYKSIVRNLSQYQKQLEDDILDAQQRLDYETQRATALVNSLYRIKYMSTKMVLHMKDVLKEDITPESVKKFYYYNQLVEDWSKIIENIKTEMSKEGVVSGPMIDVIASIESSLNTAKSLDTQMGFEGSVQLLKETLEPLTAKVKDYYEKIISELEKKGAPERLLNKYKEEYKQASLEEKDLREWLGGQRGDTHPISAWLESFMNIQDPVVFGLAKYINDNISDVLVKAQQRQNSILMSLEPMLRKAGLDLKDYERLHNIVTYKEKEPIYDSNGKYVERERHAFLHHLKGWRAEIGKLQDQIREAEKKRVETGDSTETDLLRAELNKLLHEQFYNDYDSRVFASESLFTKDEIGKKAYIARQNILNKIRNLDATIKQKTDLYDTEYQAERDLHWQEYGELYSYAYPDGTLKKEGTDDYEITKRLLEHREASREFYEWVPIQGMFQGSLRSYEEQLRVQGITGKEFDEMRQAWIDENTKVKIKPQFWEDVQDLIQQLKDLKEKMPVNIGAQLKLDELFKELNDQMSAFRDEDGQPDALIMSQAKLDRILEIDAEIASAREDLANYTGLTEEQEEFKADYVKRANAYVNSKFDPRNMEVDQYTELYNEFRELNPDDTVIYDEIMDKLSIGEDPTIKEAISDILLKLNALRSRTATKQYITKLNSFIKTSEDGTGIKPSTLKNRFGKEQFDSTNVNTILDDTAFLEQLFNESPEFKKWFNDNHQEREFTYEYGPNAGQSKISYKRSSAWSVTRPNSEEYYETTPIYDDAGNVIEEIVGVPVNKYWRRQLKEEYRTKRITFKEALEMGDVSKATVDELGRWIPKPDSKYRNEEYYILERKNKAEFDLLNTLHLYHQQNQEGLNKNSRLGVYLPRFRKDNYESIASGEAKDKVTSMIKNFKASFTKAADDYEEGYNAENQITYVTLDMFDSQVSGIPIMGKADLSIEETSEDTIMGMMRYMLSAERQKKLIEINPNIRAVQKVVNNQVGGIKDMLKGNKQDYLTKGITTFATRKGRSVRSQVINAMIERELEGKQLVGVTENLAWANKLAGNLMKMSSFAFFAFDAASALKNAFNAQFQSVIAAAGGDNLDMTSLAKGAYWAQFATSQISFEIYKFGPKSLNVQLVEMFDPEATRFDKEAGRKFAESATRTFTRDVANMQWFTNFRSWTQLNSVLQLFGGMMNHQKVNQTIGGVTREIPYIEAWEIKDGQLVLKEGIDKSWDIGGKKFTEMRNKVQAANKNLNGSLSKMDQPMANRYLLYRMVAYMKTWFTRQFMSRWGFRGNWKNPGARWDVQANDMSIGYYIQVMDTLRRGIMTLGADFKYMTPRELAAAKKVGMELGIIILGSALIGLLFDYDDDDEERYAKLREKSGPLPGLFVADTPFEFNATGWMENQALFLAKTTMNELEAMTPIFGYDDYINMLKLDSVAVSSTVVNIGKTIQAITQLLINDPSSMYKRAVGPYEWQQEGEYKTLNYLLKSVGLSGKIIDPVNALKNFESAQNRFK
jgi:hypothetical protein